MNTQSKTDVDQMLAESFKDLALRMPIDKITIKQITDRSEERRVGKEC